MSDVIVVIGSGAIGLAITRRVSPGFVMTPLSRKELQGPHRASYERMLEACAGGRPGTPDEVGNVGALLMGDEGGFISGSDFLVDGGVTAAHWYGDLKL